MYLVDTNIWLERLLGQEHSDDVGRFLDAVDSNQLFITDFSFHSICIILARLNRLPALIEFAEDIFVNAAIGLLTVPPSDVKVVVDVMYGFKLDFDDAYQYVAAEGHELIIVSFDSDFDKLRTRKLTPQEVVATLE
jgi:predicted nucleic acid-binding protein